MPAGGTKKLWAVACLVATVISVATAPAANARIVRSRWVAPGVHYAQRRLWHPRQRINILSARLGAPSALRVALGTGELSGFERTSAMAKRRGAIAAINGDFGRPSGRPVMTFARAGGLDQTALIWGRNFAVDYEETRAYIGHPHESVQVFAPDTGTSFEIARVNAGPPRWNGFVLYTPAGGALERPSRRTCGVRLFPAGGSGFGADGLGVERVYEIDRIYCSLDPMPVRGGVVLSSRMFGPSADRLLSMQPGQRLVLSWSLGWAGVRETIGGNPTLVEGGRIAVGRSSLPFFRRNPRSGIGTTADGRVLLVTVDGRKPGYSAGMTLRAFARLFRKLGATWALNLDGGGSTTMVVHGKVVNRPSDGSERAVSSALLVVPAARAGVPTTPVAGRQTDGRIRSSWRAAARDPASTGGLMSSLRRRGARLPNRLSRAARSFDRARASGRHRAR